MLMIVQESFPARRIAANGTLVLTGKRALGGFIADVTGTATLTINGVAVLTAIPVTAGVFVPLPFAIAGTSSLVLAGGAAGCAAVV